MSGPTIKVLCCPTAFKGSLGALEAADAMARGVEAVAGPGAAAVLPLSDGGPGLIEALMRGTRPVSGHELATVDVSGPLGAPAAVRLLGFDDEMIIESADAIGLDLLAPNDRDPLAASSSGLGEAIAATLEKDLLRAGGKLVIGLGGSATVDGGTGMARLFGYRFLDSSGAELPEGGGRLADLAAIEPGTPPDIDIVALTDVRSPLCGPDGAARRFAAQKGATLDEVDRLEAGLQRLGERIEQDLGIPVAGIEGAGAAGGLGAGCVAFLGARLEHGASWILERVGFDDALAACDLVVTGEGAWDATSDLGKVVHEVIERSRLAGRTVLLACGRVEGAAARDGVVAVDGGGAWLDGEKLARLVATALREHPDRLQGSRGPA